MSLTFSNPPCSAYGAEPWSVEEVDAHPDRDRLWATIVRVRDEMREEVDGAEEELAAVYDEVSMAHAVAVVILGLLEGPAGEGLTEYERQEEILRLLKAHVADLSYLRPTP